jgi:hypothetical protein
MDGGTCRRQSCTRGCGKAKRSRRCIWPRRRTFSSPVNCDVLCDKVKPKVVGLLGELLGLAMGPHVGGVLGWMDGAYHRQSCTRGRGTGRNGESPRPGLEVDLGCRVKKCQVTSIAQD